MIRFFLPAALILSLVLGAGFWLQTARVDALRDDLASRDRTITALRERAAQARLAADVAQAHAERVSARAVEYDRLRAALTEGDDDAPLPDWFRRYLRDLGLGRVRAED